MSQYNADIPFEHQPAPGFYDVTEERSKVFVAPIGSSLRALEGKRAQEIEEQGEKNKKRKGNDGKSTQTQQFVAAREAQIKKLKEQEQVIRRRKLDLPMPQVGERELEDIVKIGQAGETARELVGTAGSDATGRLLGEYEGLGQAKMARTPRTAPTRELFIILVQAGRARQADGCRGQRYGRSTEPAADDQCADATSRSGEHAHAQRGGGRYRLRQCYPPSWDRINAQSAGNAS